MKIRRLLGIITVLSFMSNACITIGLLLGTFKGTALLGQIIILSALICLITGTCYNKLIEKVDSVK